ncbi:MAG TPA: hypothetical protein DEA08_29070 [Planctomycetes bacterium]|mgnify:CR=1 FL=1|nr:hypothetical protein [Planctomycetota bacterium]
MSDTYSSTVDTVRVARGAALEVAPSPNAACYASVEATLDLPCWLSDDLASGPPAGAGLSVPAFQLVILRDGHPLGRHVFASDSVVIGRAAGCDVRLDEPTVSRAHARIEGGVIVDLASANGVYVNGERVTRHRLQNGDLVRLSDYELIFQLAPMSGSTSAAPSSPSWVESDDDLQRVLGRTLRLDPRRHDDQAERSVRQRAYLLATGEGRRLQPRACQFVLDRDLFLIGGDEGCDLKIEGFWIPRLLVAILRGPAGYTLDPLGRWPARVYLANRPVLRRQPLEDKDRLTVAGQGFVFRLG